MTEPRILIVEDEQITAMEVQSMLEDIGYSVVDIVDTGEAALAAIEDDHVELVIMDIRLPGSMDGIEATKEINDRFEDLPVLYFSAHSDEKTLEKARETEPSGFLIKPITEEDLRSSIEVALGPKKS